MGIGKQGNPLAGLDDDTQNLVKNEGQRVHDQATQAIGLQNIGKASNPFGTTNTGYDPQTGQVTQETVLSEPQQGILNNLTGITQSSLGHAQAGLDNYTAFNQSGSPEERARIEEEAYNRLTRNVDRDFNQERENLEQRMYNRGIPLDPSNPAYKREMDSLNEKYGTLKENARQTAVTMGGQEHLNSFNMGLQGHRQQVDDIGTMQQQGIGLQMGPDVAFQAPQLNQSNAAEVALQNKALGIQQQQVNQMKPTGGGGGDDPDDNSGLD
jgi:hypothetical protein